LVPKRVIGDHATRVLVQKVRSEGGWNRRRRSGPFPASAEADGDSRQPRAFCPFGPGSLYMRYRAAAQRLHAAEKGSAVAPNGLGASGGPADVELLPTDGTPWAGRAVFPVLPTSPFCAWHISM
jgi:hypothetical protein